MQRSSRVADVAFEQQVLDIMVIENGRNMGQSREIDQGIAGFREDQIQGADLNVARKYAPHCFGTKPHDPVRQRAHQRARTALEIWPGRHAAYWSRHDLYGSA
jgi:hypothetical protein